MKFKSCWDHEGMAQAVLNNSGYSSHLHCTHAWRMVVDWQREEWLLDSWKYKREEAVRVYITVGRGRCPIPGSYWVSRVPNSIHQWSLAIQIQPFKVWSNHLPVAKSWKFSTSSFSRIHVKWYPPSQTIWIYIPKKPICFLPSWLDVLITELSSPAFIEHCS